VDGHAAFEAVELLLEGRVAGSKVSDANSEGGLWGIIRCFSHNGLESEQAGFVFQESIFKGREGSILGPFDRGCSPDGGLNYSGLFPPRLERVAENIFVGGDNRVRIVDVPLEESLVLSMVIH
jgi:hypothetical protein